MSDVHGVGDDGEARRGEVLRVMLRDAVPDAPVTVSRAAPLVATAERRRRRRRAIGTGLLAAVVVVAVMAGPVLIGDSLRQAPAPAAPAGADREGAAPERADPCPAVIDPDLDVVELTSEQLATASSVRLCAGRGPASLVPADALVSALPRFAQDVAAASQDPVDGAGECGPAVGVWDERAALVVTLADGAAVTLPAVGACGVLEIDGEAVSPLRVGSTWLEALAAQRESLPAPSGTRGSSSAARCGAPATIAPIDPTADEILLARLCDGDGPGQGTGLDAVDFAALDSAWGLARQRSWSGVSGDRLCGTAAGEKRHLVAVTARGEVVRLMVSTCGDLSWSGWRGEQGIPTTLAALRSTRTR